MIRAAIVGFAVLLAAMIDAGTAPAAAQSGFDRPGGDYANAPVPNGDPAVCAARCEREPRCRAWSFSYPAGSNSPAMCWLKRDVVPRVEASCCVSGVRGAGVIEPRARNREFAIERPGGDYRSIEVPPEANGDACRLACQKDTQCRAWTYMRPGYAESGGARCYLKSHVTAPRHRPCCISGVER